MHLQSTAMAVQPRSSTPEEEEEEQEEDDGFTFPTPPPQLLGVGAGGARGRDFLHLPAQPPPCSASASSSPPVWMLMSSSSSSPIRRSFSAADCAAASSSPWRDRVLLARHRHRHRHRGLVNSGGSSPALTDYAARFLDDEEEEEEERMDSLWEDLNDDDDLVFGRPAVHVSRRRSVAGVGGAAQGERRVVGKDGKDHQLEGVARNGSVVLGASRSSRRRAPGLVTMMRALKRMFVAHKGKSRVHRDKDEYASASASASASAYSSASAYTY